VEHSDSDRMETCAHAAGIEDWRDRRIAELLEANNRYQQEARILRAILKSYMAAQPRVMGFYRHLKRGSVYARTLLASAQCSTEPIEEGDDVAVYVSGDGKAFVRKLSEFYDGRFEVLDPLS